MKEKQLTIEEKIEKIQTSESFEDLKTGWFPQSASTSYYFVSYCHKDYKKVFVDMLGMQQCDSEIAVWYDRELNVGRNWEKEAKIHINDFDCLGVIFYISENSVQSPAVFKEMQMVIDADKPFIPIVLPIENINGNAGKYLSGAELLDAYLHLSEDDEKYRLYHKMFGENIIYLKNTDSPQEKTERMKKSFTRTPLLGFGFYKDFNEKKVEVLAVNNINAIEVNEDDYRFLSNNQPIDISRIGKCAFSNCRQLETVILPKTVTTISDYAFCNCKKLKVVTLSEDSRLKIIGEHAFDNCNSLTSITIPYSVTEIRSWAFASCISLTSLTIPDNVTSIGDCAFSDCYNLTSITILSTIRSADIITIGDCYSKEESDSGRTSVMIPYGVTSIGKWAFSDCYNLTSITIPNSVTSIGTGAFCECYSLTSIKIPNSVSRIEGSAFVYCFNLKSIIFAGTMEEWDKICKGVDLGIEHEVIVTCTDGILYL